MGYTSQQELAKLGKWYARFLMLFLSGMLWRADRINHAFIAHQMRGRGKQWVLTGHAFLGWGHRGVLETWLVTQSADCNSRSISRGVCQHSGAFYSKSAKIFELSLLKTVEVSDPNWRKAYCFPWGNMSTAEGGGVVSWLELEIWGQARLLPWAPDSHIRLPGEHVCWNVSQAHLIQSVQKWPIILPSPAPAVLKIKSVNDTLGAPQKK